MSFGTWFYQNLQDPQAAEEEASEEEDEDEEEEDDITSAESDDSEEEVDVQLPRMQGTKRLKWEKTAIFYWHSQSQIFTWSRRL